ncbi:MAG: D-aminoacyl-tRNA deacylase [Planctomycetota bacterium]
MLAVVQRVSSASVTVGDRVLGSIGPGFLVLLGVMQGDDERQAEILSDRICGLRVFNDAQGKMNLSLADVKGELLVVSQFTLGADVRRGRRPSFSNAASPEEGKRLYEHFCNCCAKLGFVVKTGEFGAMMKVALVNDGPVTITFDSRIYPVR